MPAPLYYHTRPCRNHVSLLQALAPLWYHRRTPLYFAPKCLNVPLPMRTQAHSPKARPLSLTHTYTFAGMHTLAWPILAPFYFHTPLLSKTRLFATSTPLCYHRSTSLLLHSLKPAADAHTAELPPRQPASVLQARRFAITARPLCCFTP